MVGWCQCCSDGASRTGMVMVQVGHDGGMVPVGQEWCRCQCQWAMMMECFQWDRDGGMVPAGQGW